MGISTPPAIWNHGRMVELPVFWKFDVGAGKRVLPLRGLGECP